MHLPFKTLPDLFRYFKNEDIARDFLEKFRWPDGRIICPSCGTKDAYRYGNTLDYKCKNTGCKSRFRVTVGTMMENTKIPLAKWYGAIWLITAHKKGISSCQLARDLGIGQKAAWFLNHRIRAMVTDQAPELLEDIVEIDETYVGGKWANMSKKKRAIMVENNETNKVAVMGLVQKSGKSRLTVIGNNTFKDIVRKNVKKDAMLITDEHKGYAGLIQEYADHFSVNHSKGEYVTQHGFTTNSVEGFFSLFKRMVIGIYHQVSPKHLHRYCEEMSYRYNSRKIKDVDRFLLTMTKTAGRLKYKDLIAPPKGKWDFDKPENK